MEEGIAVKHPIPLNELLSSLLASQPEDSELFSDSGESQSCPNCGFTLEGVMDECPELEEFNQRKRIGLSNKKQGV